MTKQESFKRRVRARMEKTGERYAAARKALLPSGGTDERSWVSIPEFGNDAVVTATGRGWNEWCDIIEAWPGHSDGHPAIAAWLEATHSLDGWWSQSVTVGYERIVGLRLPFQRPDGTFTAGKSRTIDIDADVLRAMLLSDADRNDLFAGRPTELLSAPSARAIRLSVGPGVAHLGVAPTSSDRTKVTVDHRKLTSPDDVAEWKFYWSEWLDALDAPD